MKVTIICTGFSSATVNLQPWRHVFEIAKGMTLKGWKITVISNVEKELPDFRNNRRYRYPSFEPYYVASDLQ